MKQAFIYLITIAALSAIVLSGASLADDSSVVIEVTDPSGTPISDAVVTLLSDQELPTNTDSLPLAVMAQREMTFVPHVLAIPKGTEVSFPNEDDFRHHIYSFSKARQFEIRLYGGDEEKRITFDTAGIVALGCNIHDAMLGYIYVADTPYVRKTGESGAADFQDVRPGPYSVTVWHPRMKKSKKALSHSIIIEGAETIKQTYTITLKRERKKSRKKKY